MTLEYLLAAMSPELAPGVHVFCSGTPEQAAALAPFATVREDEGLTLVLLQAEADAAGLPYDYVAARITLRVHSELSAVGLTAAVSRALAEAGISCNVLAGLHHDHLLVPHERAAEALEVLQRLQASARG